MTIKPWASWFASATFEVSQALVLPSLVDWCIQLSIQFASIGNACKFLFQDPSDTGKGNTTAFLRVKCDG